MAGDGSQRWSRLFADLEAQYDAAAAAELEADVRDRSRGETARLLLVDRLRPAVGRAIQVDLVAAGPARAVLAAVGPDWLLLDDGADLLVPHHSVLSVSGLTAWTSDPASVGQVQLRLGLRYALRELVRRRLPVTVTLVGAGVLHGTLDRVGADFIEIAEHLPGEARRARAVRGVRAVPLGALAAVRSG